MATALDQAAAKTLFNDPTLSDVTIKQIYKGKTREYYGHKAILCAQSSYFMKAFTGSFKEANEAAMEIHDDDPDHFEFALKFIYTLEYNAQEIEAKTKIGNDAKKRQALFIVGAYIVADKYDIRRLLPPAADHLKRVLAARADTTILESVIEEHYNVCSTPGAPVGKVTAPTIISTFHGYVKTDKFAALLKEYPVFAADIAGYYYEQGMFNIRRVECQSCQRTIVCSNTVVVAGGGYAHCPYVDCLRQQPIVDAWHE